jgi:ATP-dependent RNA helicase RhlE
LPSDRQNLLFSATMPKAIRQLAEQILNDPHIVEIAHTAPALRIEHALYPIAAERKKDLLDRLLAEDDCNSAIVFTRTKHRAKRLAIQLSKQGLRAIALQGNMSQAQRDRAMNGFRKGSYDILVATDIAARGLDVAGIDYVINFDPPSTPDIYTHRIGRTGRSDASGKACTFVTRDDADWVRDTERVLDASIPQRYWPGFDREPIVAGKGARGARPAGRPSNAKTRSGGGDRRNNRPAKRGRSRKRGGRSASSAANR